MMHVSQYILELIKNNKINLKYKISLSITYHDNCSIGRKMARVGKSVYDEPREILKKIPCINLIEAKDTRNDAYCCGAITTKTFGLGTDLNLFKKDKSYYIHKELFEYLINNGSNNLVTPCMGCAIIYEDSSRTLSPKLGKKINILELSELVNKSMGIKIPKRYFDHNNLISLSPPFIKFSAIKILPRLIKNHAFKDLFKFIKDITIYILKKRK
ncbi:MAG: heterodisulfide reductase-related iron-sulfur binding cluster [Candidatus Helarchaeota archaeon]